MPSAYHPAEVTGTAATLLPLATRYAASGPAYVTISRNSIFDNGGLGIDLGNDGGAAGSLRWLPEELREQFTRFCELMGRPPTHLDSHHNIHRDPQVLPYFLELAHEHGLPLREHSPVRYFSKFYGQWGGQTHLEQVSVARLIRMLETEIPEGFTELSCHPGYRDPEFSSGYSVEREAELRTLCDPAIRQAIGRQSIQLISYYDLGKLAESRAAE